MKLSIVFSIAITACTANPVLAQGDQHASENSLDASVVRLRGSDEEDSEAAATSLRRLGPKAAPAVPALVKALGDPDQGVRANAAICLGFIGHQAKAAVPALSRLLMDQNEVDTVRSWAALSLGRIGPDALPVLIEALKPGSDVFVRGAAANAVGKMGPKAEPAIPQLLVLQRRLF
jgi:HEAT repeat protein